MASWWYTALGSTLVLKLVLPKGSLEKATLELFEAADLQVNRSSDVAYKATIDDAVGNSMSSAPLTAEIDTSVQVVSFQQGASGYTNTVDTMLQQATPTADNSASSQTSPERT